MAEATSPPKKALEIFPLEVWEVIFDNLESPTDVASCYRACGDWGKLFEAKRTSFLMAEVFPLIVKYLTVEEDSTNGSEAEENPNPILSTRQVCKSWKYAVDSFLQNHPSHSNIDFPKEEENLDPSEDINAVPIKHYDFDAEFFEELECLAYANFPPDCNPVLTRYVNYSEMGACTWDSLHRLRNSFHDLLESHGTHIWHASLSMGFTKKSGAIQEKRSIYNLFNRCVSNMPNLKTFYVPFNGDCVSFSLHRTPPSLEQLLVSYPLPKFEHLSTLKMKNVPPYIEKGLLLKNSHVQKLFWVSESIAVSAPWLLKLQMNNLEEFATNVDREEDLQTLQSLPWPLKKLAIRSKSLPLDSIFQAISASPFANNLKHLIVHADGDEDFNNVTTGKLELPNLFTFLLRVDDIPLETIDFLLPSNAFLSNLQIEMNAEYRNGMTTRSTKKAVGKPIPNQVVQFHGYIPTMLESNIWNRFPKLKRLKIVRYDPNHVRDLFFSCCGGKPDDNHFKNEKYEYTRAAWKTIGANQSK